VPKSSFLSGSLKTRVLFDGQLTCQIDYHGSAELDEAMPPSTGRATEASHGLTDHFARQAHSPR
jgi:hypothetical protein